MGSTADSVAEFLLTEFTSELLSELVSEYRFLYEKRERKEQQPLEGESFSTLGVVVKVDAGEAYK
jgi:hypothetical protein